MREEKAADWRLITQSTVATLATTGAVLAAGLSIRSYAVIIAAPLLFYAGVLSMIQSARLQMRLITFLAKRSPPGSLDYEGQVATARNDPSMGEDAFPKLTQSWDWWRLVAGTLGLLISLFPLAAGCLENLKRFPQDKEWIYVAAGLLMLVAFGIVSQVLAQRISEARSTWETYWGRDDVRSDQVP